MMKRDDPNDNIPAEMMDMALIPLNSSYSTALKISDLSNASQDLYGNYLFTYKINQNIASLISNYFTQGANELLQIEPRLYWNGISRLVIDYVDIEDTIYRSLTGPNATTIKANIVNRVNQLTQGYGNM